MANSKELANAVGAKIRKLRRQKGLSLEKLALECDMNAAFLGHVERGLRCPTIYTLQRICNGLEISIAELFLLDCSEAQNAASIQHINEKLSGLTPQQLTHVARMIDEIVSLLNENEKRQMEENSI